METIIERFAEVTNDSEKLFLIEKISDKGGFFKQKDRLMFLIKNDENLLDEIIKAEFVAFYANVNVISVANDQTFDTGCYNILEFSGNTGSVEMLSFIKLCRMFLQNEGEFSFRNFFLSLMNLFKESKDSEFKNILGLMGELLFIRYIFDNYNVNLSKYWQVNGSRSKYDFIFDSHNFEIKSNLSLDKNVRIKHNQIFNFDNNYLVIVNLEKDIQTGMSWNDIYQYFCINDEFKSNFNFIMMLEMYKNKLEISSLKTTKFIVRDISLYVCADNNFFQDIADEVANLEYDLDLNSSENISEAELIAILKMK